MFFLHALPSMRLFGWSMRRAGYPLPPFTRTALFAWRRRLREHRVRERAQSHPRGAWQRLENPTTTQTYGRDWFFFSGTVAVYVDDFAGSIVRRMCGAALFFNLITCPTEGNKKRAPAIRWMGFRGRSTWLPSARTQHVWFAVGPHARNVCTCVRKSKNNVQILGRACRVIFVCRVLRARRASIAQMCVCVSLGDSDDDNALYVLMGRLGN